MNIIARAGYPFAFDRRACGGCGGICCSGRQGHVWVNAGEIDCMADFLGMTCIDVIDRFLHRVDNRWSIREKHHSGRFDCIFFDAGTTGCTIYEVRPQQCRRFPFWDRYRVHPAELLGECPGVRKIGTPG